MVGSDAAPAVVLRKHGSGTPRVAVRPNYVGLPSMAGRGKDQRGESRAVGPAKSRLSDPGSTAPGREIAAMERPAARVRRSGRPRRKAWTFKGAAGRSIPSHCARRCFEAGVRAPLNIPGALSLARDSENPK